MGDIQENKFGPHNFTILKLSFSLEVIVTFVQIFGPVFTFTQAGMRPNSRYLQTQTVASRTIHVSDVSEMTQTRQCV